MEIIRQTIASLGSPTWIDALEDRGGNRGTFVVRWRHEDGRIAILAPDAVRVIVSLSSGQQVRHTEGDSSVFTRSQAGHATVFAAGEPSETAVEGEADVVQIFMTPESLGATGETLKLGTALVATSNEALKCAAIQLFVAARRGDFAHREMAEGRLWHVVRGLLAIPPRNAGGFAVGGLPPAVMRKVEKSIAEAMERSPSSSPKLAELATAAGLSINHFIRAFRQRNGSTPHQLIMLRRLERAMNLLRQPSLTIGDVAHATGYSSPAYFVLSFKRGFGVTPGAYQSALGMQ